jgi:hypothetical protein
MSYYDAYELVSEAHTTTTAAESSLITTAAATAVTAVSVTKALLEDAIENVPVRQWINDDAMEQVREYVAVEEKFNELGLSYTGNANATALAQVESMWESIGADFEKLGISRSSYEDIALNSAKRSEIFRYYYGATGPEPVSDDEIKAYLLENQARIDYIAMELKDGEGNLLKSEGKAEMMTRAEDYIKRAESGEDFDTLLSEYNAYYDKLIADATAAAEAADETAEEETTEDAAAEEDSSGDDLISNEQVIYKTGATPAASVVTKVFEEQVSHPGETLYFIVEDPGGEMYYVVKLMDLFSDPLYLEANRLSVISTLKSEAFDEIVKSWITGQDVKINEKAVKRYKPDKIEQVG